jgi:PAS domain S-box-containing protein
MGERIRAYDWTSTPLGPPAQWPQSLKTAIRIMLASRQPIWIGWGEELIYFYNDPYKSIIRGRHPIALGKPTMQVWPEIWPVIGPMLETAMEGVEGTYVEEQLLIMERDGWREETYYTYSYTPIPDERGEAAGILCVNTDDTQRVISQRQLSLLGELGALTADLHTWHEVCERASQALAGDRKDLPFSLFYVLDESGASASLVGTVGIRAGHASAPQTIALSDSSLWPLAETLQSNTPQIISDLRERHLDLPSEPWSQPPAMAVALPVTASNEHGRSGVLIVGLNPFRQYNEDYKSFLSLICRQITGAITIATSYEQERKRAEALAELDRAKTVFFNNVSHEFRTPLTLMLGPIEELQTRAGNSEQRQQIELLYRNSLRLLKMVNSLLEFSRLEAGRIEACYEPTDLAAATTELASVFRSAIEKAGLRFKVECPRLPEPVYVDREMWEKIVLNLISNALKFTFKGEISVALRWCGERVELSVRDTGVGIPPAELPKLFQRFFRVRGAASRTHEGTGIGLALVQELARLHGGEARVESKEDRGSTFIVSIQTGRAHLPPENIRAPLECSQRLGATPFVQEALRWLPETASADNGPPEKLDLLTVPSKAPPLDAPRILLADDNSDMREYVRRLLGSAFRVEAVADGQAALERIQVSRPDLVITDVMMPRVDGFALLKQLRSDAHTRTLPVIMLSARAGEEARIEGLDAGADDYLIKPFGARELLARVESHLKLARLRRENEERVRQSEERFQIAARATNDVIWDADLVAGTVSWNEAIVGLTGLSREQIRPDASWWYEHIHEKDYERVAGGIRAVIDGAANFWRDEYRFRRADGSYAHIFDRGYVIRDAAGKAVRMIGAMQDVTERKKAEEELHAAHEQLADRAIHLDNLVQQRTATLRDTVGELEAFSYSIAHDMRAPLRAIQGFAQILTEEYGAKIDATGQSYLRRMSTSANRMDRLITDVLNYSRVVRFELPVEPIDLDALLRGILESYPSFHARDGEISIEGKLPTAVGNEAALTQVFSNLIGNALKFVATGTRPHLRIRAEKSGDRVRVFFRDNGIGIGRDYHEKIFGIFQRIDKSYEGTGIGLAIAKKATERMSGSIGLESEPGKGSTFWIELPTR